jgi:hypothetical protein
MSGGRGGRCERTEDMSGGRGGRCERTEDMSGGRGGRCERTEDMSSGRARECTYGAYVRPPAPPQDMSRRGGVQGRREGARTRRPALLPVHGGR